MDKTILFCIFYTCTLSASISLADEAPPSIELLEYLANVETSNGDWLDPLEMNELASNEQIESFEQEKSDE